MSNRDKIWIEYKRTRHEPGPVKVYTSEEIAEYEKERVNDRPATIYNIVQQPE